MAKPEKYEPLTMKITPWWTILIVVLVYLVFQWFVHGRIASGRDVIEWLLYGVLTAVVSWLIWIGGDYRTYAKQMLPLVDGCPEHPSYHGKSDPAYWCDTCTRIRVVRLQLFPKERKTL